MNNVMAKRGLTGEQLMMVQSEVDKKAKNKNTGLLLWWFTGVFAGHRFYSGDTVYAICMLLFGWCTAFIWNFVDLFFISKAIERYNEQLEADTIERIKAYTTETPKTTAPNEEA